MASKASVSVPEYLETGLEPEFSANHVTYEPAPGGIVRGFVWKLVHGRYVLQYTFMTTGAELVQMGRQAMQVGSDAHNVSQWKDEMTEH